MSQGKSKIDIFIDEYILAGCKKATQAAINAGYAEKSAHVSASRLLKNDKVIQAIKDRKKLDTKLFIKTKEEKLIALEEIFAACMAPDAERGMVNAQAAIAAIKEHNVMQGDNAPTLVDNTHTIIKTDDENW